MKQFLQDTYCFKLKTKLIQIVCDQINPQLTNLFFESTIFHPQGGGQPSDSGHILINGQQIKIQDVKIDKKSNQIIHQINTEELQQQQLPTEIEIFIDEQKRKLNARLHSAGHLLDISVKNLGLGWEPSKGYHFPDSPYVEYIGEIDNKDQQKVIDQLNEQNKNLIQNINDSVEILNYQKDDATKIYGNKYDKYFEFTPEIRVIKLTNNDEGCPCGGTHVKKVQDILQVIVTKIVKKKKNIRVCYKID